MNKTTKTTALCAIMAALSAVVMLLGGIIPVMTYCSPVIASLFLIPIIDRYGKRWALITYIVISLLSLLLSPDKESAFFWVFFSWYPILKPLLDQKIKKIYVRYFSKIIIFSAATFLMYFITCSLLGIEEIVESFSSIAIINILFYLLVVVVMLIYDFMLGRIYVIYRDRFRKFL